MEFRFAWGRHDQKLVDDARQFWREQDVMSPEDIEARAKDLCVLAYSSGRVAAASTVYLYDFPRLRSRFAYYRTLVGADFRRQKLSARLCVFSRDAMKQWARENPEEKLKGLFIIPEAEEYRPHLHEPVIRRHGLEFVLVGYTPGGYQMRVVWFDDATVE